MKFNIFDQNTWQPSPRNLEEIVTNKAVGSIGQVIGQLRILKEHIENENALNDNDEYRIAYDLYRVNEAAFTAMDIHISYSGEKVAEALRSINMVLDFWKNEETRRTAWRTIIPSLEQLKPYLDGHTFSQYKFKELIKTDVTGNAAWKAYLGLARLVATQSNRLKLYDDDAPPESEDYFDTDDNENADG